MSVFFLPINNNMPSSFSENILFFISGFEILQGIILATLLLNPENENYTILSIGFEAGSNSKTTFNTMFKKFTDLHRQNSGTNRKKYRRGIKGILQFLN
jgi:hypothetical protein